ncbi:hypothetical protein KVK76_04635 [Helicobacter pylori]|nr:hypothetical protein KVK76_04635 [Helicobacter pylori]
MKKAAASVAYRDDLREVDFVWGIGVIENLNKLPKKIQGMLKFTPKSRYIDNKAIKEYYNTNLKPDELLAHAYRY